MKNINRWLIALLVLTTLSFWSCQKDDDDDHDFEHPSDVEDIEGSDFSRVKFTERATERIGIQTAEVVEETHSASKKIVPYSSLLYGPEGQTWIYTSPEPRVFVRLVVEVDRIEGDKVYLNNGPPVGTKVATVGVAEIYGTEFEIGH
jgi:hypothetical protein